MKRDCNLSIQSFEDKLFGFVRSNCLEELRKELHDPIYDTDDEGRNLLQIACYKGFYDIATYLVSIGFDVNKNLKNKNGLTVLQECIQQEVCDKKKLIKLLIDHEADVNVRNSEYKTILHIAAKKDLDRFKYFIDNKIYKNIYDVDSYGNNVLHMACIMGNYDLILYLLSIKYDINKTNNRNRSAIHHSVRNGNIIATKLLVDHNIDVDIKESKLGYFALHFASYYYQLDILKYFINNNIYNNIYDVGKNGDNILHIACDHGNRNFVEYLLSIECDMNKVDKANESAFYYCVRIGDLITTILLLNHNIDISIKDSWHGRSALHVASYFNHLDILKYFIDNNTYNIYDIDSVGNNILHIACFEGYYNIVDYLISIGYDINKTIIFNESAYTISLERGHIDISNLLNITFKSFY